MNGRLLLSLFIAVLPISVEMGATPDTTSRTGADEAPLGAETTFRAAGSVGEFAIIQRGCNGKVLDVAKTQLTSGALEVQHRFSSGVVIGARGGQVVEDAGAGPAVPFGTVTPGMGKRTNAYANPYVGFDGASAGVGVGWLRADHRFIVDENETIEPDVTAHLRLGGTREQFVLRFMEGMPLESEGALTAEVGGPVGPRTNMAAFIGFMGPFDGALLGLKGDVWLTPEAALSIKLGLSGHGQYSAGAGAIVRFGGR